MDVLATTFFLGIASAASPCLLPLYPGFIAYLAGTGTEPDTSHSRTLIAALLGLAVLGGILTTMVFLGVVLSLLAVPFGDVLKWSIPVSTAVLVVLGLVLLSGRNPFARLAGVRVPIVSNRAGQAYVYGLLVGPVALPCAGPFLLALLAISVGIADAATRVGTFLVYGLGFGLPLVGIAALGAVRGRRLTRALARHHGPILRVAGAFTIVAAIYGLISTGYA